MQPLLEELYHFWTKGKTSRLDFHSIKEITTVLYTNNVVSVVILAVSL